MKIFLLMIMLALALGQIEVLRKTKNRIGNLNLANSAGKFDMDNEQDLQYFTYVGIGTPPQKCSMIFDTGSNEFWVSTIYGDYHHERSSTYNKTSKPSNITYGRGFVSGYLGTEMVSIAELKIKNLKQEMLFVDRTEKMVDYTDGLLGLANDKDSPNWLDLAYQSGQLPDAQFAFDLRNQDEITYFYAGSSSFPSETLTWVGVDMKYYWAVSVKSTTIDGKTEEQEYSSKSAVVDTGTSLLLMGNKGYKMLKENTEIKKCQYDSSSEMYICKCSTRYPTVTFNSQEYNYLAVPSDYMIKLQGGYCVFGVSSNEGLGMDLMIFGDSLMRNYFVAYDKTKNDTLLANADYLGYFPEMKNIKLLEGGTEENKTMQEIQVNDYQEIVMSQYWMAVSGCIEVEYSNLLKKRELRRYALAFDSQSHYAVFYAYIKLKEQEIRNIVWLAEIIARKLPKNHAGWKKVIVPFSHLRY